MNLNLKYRVHSVSSECDEFPAGDLQDQRGGWQSARNCSYPQELTLQFYIPIQTKNMKIVFHQYKIPKLIQVFVKCGKHEKYRKLGIVQPNDNVQSNYLQRQLKTVFFEFPCTFVKLVIHQNYRNQMNLFDQVAINSLIFEGEFVPSATLKNLEANVLDWVDSSSEDQKNNVQNDFDAKIVRNQETAKNFSSLLYPEVFQKLEQAKFQAVERQEFQKADYIKKTIISFQEAEKDILKLEELKRIALEQQDYDKCHKLKHEITRKKQVISFQIRQFQDQILMQGQSLSLSRASQNRSNFNTHRQNSTLRLQTQQMSQRTPVVNRNQPHAAVHQYDNQVVPALLKKKNVEQSYMSVQKVNESVYDPLKSPNIVRKQQFQQGEESVDMHNYDINRVIVDFPKLQLLDSKQYKKYSRFFGYIRQQIWRMVLSEQYHKNWKLKGMALQEVMTYEITEGEHLIAIFQLVAITICDKYSAINIKKSLQLLQKLVDLPNKQLDCDPSYPRFFADVILGALIQIMNDTKQQFRKMAIQIYKNLPEFALIYMETAIKAIIKSSPSQSTKATNKRKSNPRLQLAKLAVIEHYLATYLDAEEHHYNEIIKWLVQCANDPSSEVKNIATQLLLYLSRISKEVHTKIKEQLLKQNKQVAIAFEQQYQSLMTEIQESKIMQPPIENVPEVDKRETVKNRNSSRVTSQQNINESLFISPHGSKQNQDVELDYSKQSQTSRSHQWFQSQKNIGEGIKVMNLQEDGEQDDEDKTCAFCCEEFEQSTIQEHLLNSCSVVLPCPYCSSCIYMRQMTQHLLYDCQKQKSQQCPRCKLSFQFDEINEHVARKMCRPARANMERCPFCEQDIVADDFAWVEHSRKCSKISKPPRINMQASYSQQ